jgi:hypothetical protein
MKPKLKISSVADIQNLNVNINWQVSTPASVGKFKPEKMILLYSENNSTYRFVNKYRKSNLKKKISNNK